MTAHVDGAWSVAFSCDGSKVLSGGADGMAKLWDAMTGQQVLPVFPHDGGIVYSVAFSPDCTKVLTGGADHKAKLWRADTAELLAIYDSHTDAVYSVAFSPDGTTLATASQDASVKLWAVPSLSCGIGLVSQYSCGILCPPSQLSAPGWMSFTSDGGTTGDNCASSLIYRLFAGRLDCPTAACSIWQVNQDCSQGGFGSQLNSPRSVLVDKQGYWPGQCGQPNYIFVGGTGRFDILDESSGAVCQEFGNASLCEIAQMAIDSSGRLFVGNSNCNCLRRVASGSVTQSLCCGATGGSPQAVAVDAADNVYVICSDDGVMRKLAPGGQTINNPMFATGLTGAISMAIAPGGIFHGNLYVACRAPANRVVEVDFATGMSSTFLSGLDAHGITFDPDGYMYVSVPSANHIVKVGPGLAGDMDGDGSVAMADLQGFVAAMLLLPDAPLPIAAADMNGDGCVNGLDIRPFMIAMGV